MYILTVRVSREVVERNVLEMSVVWYTRTSDEKVLGVVEVTDCGAFALETHIPMTMKIVFAVSLWKEHKHSGDVNHVMDAIKYLVDFVYDLHRHELAMNPETKRANQR